MWWHYLSVFLLVGLLLPLMDLGRFRKILKCFHPQQQRISYEFVLFLRCCSFTKLRTYCLALNYRSKKMRTALTKDEGKKQNKCSPPFLFFGRFDFKLLHQKVIWNWKKKKKSHKTSVPFESNYWRKKKKHRTELSCWISECSILS